MIYCQLGMIEPFRVLQNSDFRLLTCASGTFTMFAKFFKRLMQVIFNWAENYVGVLKNTTVRGWSLEMNGSILGIQRKVDVTGVRWWCWQEDFALEVQTIYRSTVIMLTRRLCLRSSNHLQEYNWSHVALLYHDHSRESGKGHSMCYFSLSSVSSPKIKNW